MNSSRKPVFVNSRTIDPDNRVACAMHTSLNAKEPLWLMIPLDEEVARDIHEIIIATSEEEYVIQFDPGD